MNHLNDCVETIFYKTIAKNTLVLTQEISRN